MILDMRMGQLVEHDMANTTITAWAAIEAAIAECKEGDTDV